MAKKEVKEKELYMSVERFCPICEKNLRGNSDLCSSCFEKVTYMRLKSYRLRKCKYFDSKKGIDLK